MKNPSLAKRYLRSRLHYRFHFPFQEIPFMNHSRVSLSQQPFLISQQPGVVLMGHGHNWGRGGIWPAHWISIPNPQSPLVAAYKLEFSLPQARKVRLHVSADERYDLFLDGERLGRGPERGDIEHWSFESYDIELGAGNHVLVGRVWSLGDKAAVAQFSVHHGFLLCPDDEELVPLLATGTAPWSAKVLGGYSWLPWLCAWGTGENVHIDGREFDWNHERGEGDGWGDTKKLWPGARSESQVEIPAHHRLYPAMLPAMMDEPRHGFRVRHVSDVKAPTSEISVRAADHLDAENANWQALLGGEKIARNSTAHFKARDR
jgi:hypothetical protein